MGQKYRLVLRLVLRLLPNRRTGRRTQRVIVTGDHTRRVPVVCNGSIKGFMCTTTCSPENNNYIDISTKIVEIQCMQYCTIIIGLSYCHHHRPILQGGITTQPPGDFGGRPGFGPPWMHPQQELTIWHHTRRVPVACNGSTKGFMCTTTFSRENNDNS